MRINEFNHYDYLEHIGKPIHYKHIFFKNLFDKLIALILLIISIPLILIFGTIVELTSKGPIFFKQKRVGHMGEDFYMIKLRSMYKNAETVTGPTWARKHDSRVTPIGRFMRNTRIDELPQFWNVLKGDMSIIGPRPERPIFTEKFYHECHKFPKRLKVKPGVTGYAQVHGGYDVTPEQRADLDNYYIKNYSIKLDIEIFFKTIIVMFTGDGAR